MALEEAARVAFRRLADGVLDAPGAAVDDTDPADAADALADGRLALSPNCRHCPYDLLCGRASLP